jgi:hypothetical protein
MLVRVGNEVMNVHDPAGAVCRDPATTPAHTAPCTAGRGPARPRAPVRAGSVIGMVGVHCVGLSACRALYPRDGRTRCLLDPAEFCAWARKGDDAANVLKNVGRRAQTRPSRVHMSCPGPVYQPPGLDATVFSVMEPQPADYAGQVQTTRVQGGTPPC